MKATGIVRRIDDLGRVVIPKEIRRTLRIREGDPLEIYTEKDGGVIFRKYSPLGDLTEFAARICEAISKNTGFSAAICDRESVVAQSGGAARAVMDRRASAQLISLLEERTSYLYTGSGARLPACEGSDWVLGAAEPVLCQGDLLGGVTLLLRPEQSKLPGSFEQKLLSVVAGFLGRQLEA